MPARLHHLKPYALLLILALPALWPSALPGLPRSNDGLAHLFRTVELDQLVRAGVLLPRWAPDLVLGFGYPVFNFFPYGAHYLVEALHLLGFGLLTAYNLAGALCLLASGWFASRLGREHFGHTAGLVAGVAYLYSPYLLYDNYVRGSLPESLALALLPLALLYLRRAVRGDRPAAAWAGLALAGAILAHQGVMLQAMPFVGLYGLWEMVSGNWELAIGKWKLLITNYQWLVLPFLLALALSAFFWLPALTEARYAQTARGTGNGAMNYSGNFLGLGQLFALPRLPVDADLLNPPVVHSLPLAALVLAGLVAARWAWPRTRPAVSGEQGRSLVFFGAAALAATLLIHPLAKPLWDAVPLLQLTLFPWRLLGPISLFVALAAGAVFVDERPGRQSGRTTNPPPQPQGAGDEGRTNQTFVPRPSSFVLLLICLLGLISAGLPFATSPREATPTNPGLAALAGFEIPPDFIGTTTVGEYLPVWVQKLPDTAADRETLKNSGSVARYAAPGAQVQPGPAQPVGATFSVQAAQPVTFVYRTFYFPGWRAALDGQPAPLTITVPEGLMAVAVPAGAHTLTFSFGTTLPRVAGDAMTVVGLAALAAWLAWRRKDITPPAPNLPSASLQGAWTSREEGRQGLWLFVFAVAVAAARPLLYDAGLTPLLRHGLTSQPPALASQPLDVSFQGEVHLWGADVPARSVGADDPVTVTLYWQAEHRLGVDYGFDMQLVDAAGQIWTQPGFTRPPDWRFEPGTDFWPPEQYLLDPYVLRLLPGTPPGQYTAQVTVFARYNQQSLGTQPVGAVTVGSPARQADCPGTLNAVLTPGLTLRQASLAPGAAAPGNPVTVSLCWLAAAAPGADMKGQLRLADPNGRLVATQPFTLGSHYGTSQWRPGDLVRDQVTLLLPAALASGMYTWSVSVGNGQGVAVGQEAVNAPPRSFTAPAVDQKLAADLGPITLWGVSGAPAKLAPGDDLKLTLQWLDTQTPELGYHVFVHLQAADGTLAAQSDGVPADWTRPTTGWLPGEYVADSRSLRLPADLASGEYTLWAGLYRPDTGERLTTAEFPDGQVAVGRLRVGK